MFAEKIISSDAQKLKNNCRVLAAIQMPQN